MSPHPAVVVAHALALMVALALPLGAAENRVRNGSFEGTSQYWITNGVPTAGDAAHGDWRMHFAEAKGEFRSASFALKPGERVTIAVSGRAHGEQAHLRLFLCPSNREVAQASKLIWNDGNSHRTRFANTWRRQEWTWTVPQVDDKGAFAGSDNNWWNKRSWIIYAYLDGAADIDGVSVTVGEEGKKAADAFVPFTPVEITTAISELPGYTSHANLVTADTVTVQAHLHHAGSEARAVTLRWELLDYRGEHRFGAAQEASVTLAPGATSTEQRALPLLARGLALARVSVRAQDGTVLAQSDHPVTRLAFPKNATDLDLRERFGASLRGGPLNAAAQAIGLRWARWHPAINWTDVQKESPDTWTFPDAAVDRLASHGLALNAVLYALPEWAKGEHRNLPKDMTWPADDPRWGDLSVVTAWDTFVTRTVRHFAGRVDTWEFVNEPDLHRHWDAAVYAPFAKRTYRLIKAANPQAQVLVNVTWPGVSGWTREFLQRGGLEAFDVHSFHNYTPEQICRPSAVTDLFSIFRSYGDTAGSKRIWFNEGWTYVPTSFDYPSLPIVDVAAPEVAHRIVRSTVELTAAGMEKLISFHIGYGKNGKSFWDWVGSGTEWWDDHGQPTVAVGTWNNLCHHLGLSAAITSIAADGAVLHVFHDERNDRGVAVAWATGDATTLAIPGTTLTRWDIMGNASELRAKGKSIALALAADRVPVFFAVDRLDGTALGAALEPLTKRDLRVAAGGIVAPPRVVGEAINTTTGNPVLVDGVPQWRMTRVWPDNVMQAKNYQTLQWNGTHWFDPANSHGGQPTIAIIDGRIELGARSSWGGNQNSHKLPALIFVPPRPGTWTLSGTVHPNIWSGQPPVHLRVIALDPKGGGARDLSTITLTENRKTVPWSVTLKLDPGEELALVATLQLSTTAVGMTIRDLVAMPE